MWIVVSKIELHKDEFEVRLKRLGTGRKVGSGNLNMEAQSAKNPLKRFGRDDVVIHKEDRFHVITQNCLLFAQDLIGYRIR
jgi:hypothetical protein